MGVSILFVAQKGGASIDRGTFKRAYKIFHNKQYPGAPFGKEYR